MVAVFLWFNFAGHLVGVGGVAILSAVVGRVFAGVFALNVEAALVADAPVGACGNYAGVLIILS